MKKKKRSKFGLEIERAILRLGVDEGRAVTITEFARKIKVTPGYLSSILIGRKFPSVEMLRRILWASLPYSGPHLLESVGFPKQQYECPECKAQIQMRD